MPHAILIIRQGIEPCRIIPRQENAQANPYVCCTHISQCITCLILGSTIQVKAMRKNRFAKQLSKKDWLVFEIIALFSACLLPSLVILLIGDLFLDNGNDLWLYLSQSVIIMTSLNLGFVLWRDNEWYKLWGWFHVALFICSFVICSVFALISINVSGFEGWKFFWGLFAYVFFTYSFIISAPLAAIAAIVKKTLG